MNRWKTLMPQFTPMGLLACACILSAQVAAQSLPGVREFPPNAVRGQLLLTQPPVGQLDGREARLAPGARIRGTDNLLVMSGAIVGQSLPVVYQLDPQGQLREVWILSPDEVRLSRRRPPSTTNVQSQFDTPAGIGPTPAAIGSRHPQR